jgi:alkanesulfonate monooxygenase SsuD/methylene tetrahydromethanopterin reductase-like flavin-dependent oxidoreductase (luciferase family)
MRFGLIYELQLPRPWDAKSEHRMVQHALAEVEVADRLGFDYVWANEHHFLEEYSHNSPPPKCSSPLPPGAPGRSMSATRWCSHRLATTHPLA